MKPVLLPPAPLQHFYRGGDRIAALRGATLESEHQPEEWLGSTVSRFGDPRSGPTRLGDGSSLADLIAASPETWTGPAQSTLASDTGMLFKLLDARQRLPVHVHPGRTFADRHLHCPYGKTEAWFVLDATPGTEVHVGWSRPVSRDEVERRTDAQDGEWMLAHMNAIPTRDGMGILVPAGQVHAIGADVFVAELQEPTDLSILLEWSATTSTRNESHLDLGFDVALDAISYDVLDANSLAALTVQAGPATTTPTSVLPPAADPYFRLHRVRGDSAAIAAGYAVAVVLEGAGTVTGTGGAVEVSGGQAFAVPYAFGPWRVMGDAEVLIGRPGAGWPETLQPDKRKELP